MTADDTARIREIREDEYPLLEEFTYQAIFLPEGAAPVDRSVLDLPEMRAYYDGFGREGEIGLVRPAGYGRVADDVLELAISLLPDYRGRGIGTRLLDALLGLAAERGLNRVSLSVQDANYAKRMYERAGFEVVGGEDGESLMVCEPASRR